MTATIETGATGPGMASLAGKAGKRHAQAKVGIDKKNPIYA